MSIVLVHLTDPHLKSMLDPTIGRLKVIARVIAGEVDASVKNIVFAFGGDAVDKGVLAGFDAAQHFLRELQSEVESLTSVRPDLVLVPGNHDHVHGDDTGLRDAAIKSLTADAAKVPPKGKIEAEILAPLDRYFAMAAELAPDATPTTANPYYVVVDKTLDGRLIRFHLLNTAWMCAKGQTMGSLWFPVNEIAPPLPSQQIEYEITLLHHPFDWLKQPEVKRALRDVVEWNSDLILTGHEHVGRSLKASVHGVADYEYLEGVALHDDDPAEPSGFHILRLDFDAKKQTISTYHWSNGFAPGSYTRALGPVEKPLGRNQRRASQAYRLRQTFIDKLDDPELAVVHKQRGKLRLSDFYTFPDLARMDNTAEQSNRRVKGEQLVTALLEDGRSLLIGPTRCGKSSLSKRLVAELHARGNMPLLLDGERLKNIKLDRLGRLLDELVEEQYEALTAEGFWQVPPEKRVLVLDNLHRGPNDRKRREQIVGELNRRFDRAIVIGSEEFCFEELFSVPRDADDKNPLWEFEHYKILPFGFIRCGLFVRQWVGLDEHQQPNEAEVRVQQITGILGQFLRNNPIPQYPWVVMVIVQQADSPEPPHAENGSYGYLLQALITAALAKSRLKFPVPGKYRWLGEFANELYRRNVNGLPNADGRAVHDQYCEEYGVTDLDYKEIRDDLAAAGVLHLDGEEISFHEAYTYCYFVAWHLAQRINAGDAAARDEVRQLCDDLYHEDTANVLVFLAHQSPKIVLDEMKARAARLFANGKETDFTTDVEHLNKLYEKAQSLKFRGGDPHKNRLALVDQQDDQRAARECQAQPKREITFRPPPDDRARQDAAYQGVMELITALRTIEILGQVLRNEATARKVPEMLEITEQVFRLGRRVLNYLFTANEDRLPQMVERFHEHYRNRMPEAEPDDVTTEAKRHVFNLYLFGAFAIVKHVSLAVGEPNLAEVFRQVMNKDGSLPNRIYKLAIDLETLGGKVSLREAEEMNDELSGKIKSDGDKKVHNNLALTLVRALVVDYFFLNYVPHNQVQALCKKMNIALPPAAGDAGAKRLPKQLPAPVA